MSFSMLVTSKLPIQTTEFAIISFQRALVPPHFEKGSATHAKYDNSVSFWHLHSISEVAMTWLLSHGKYKCVLSHSIPWDSHRNDIPMDKPVFLIYAPNHNRFVSKVAGFTFRGLCVGI